MEATEYLNMILECYRQLYSIACQQRKLLSMDKIPEFFVCFSKVHELQQKVTTLSKKIASVQKASVKGEKLQELKEQISSVHSSLQNLYAEIEELITQKREHLADELAKLRKGQKALKTYAPKNKSVPRFFNGTT